MIFNLNPPRRQSGHSQSARPSIRSISIRAAVNPPNLNPAGRKSASIRSNLNPEGTKLPVNPHFFSIFAPHFRICLFGSLCSPAASNPISSFYYDFVICGYDFVINSAMTVTAAQNRARSAVNPANLNPAGRQSGQSQSGRLSIRSISIRPAVNHSLSGAS